VFVQAATLALTLTVMPPRSTTKGALYSSTRTTCQCATGARKCTSWAVSLCHNSSSECHMTGWLSSKLAGASSTSGVNLGMFLGVLVLTAVMVQDSAMCVGLGAVRWSLIRNAYIGEQRHQFGWLTHPYDNQVGKYVTVDSSDQCCSFQIHTFNYDIMSIHLGERMFTKFLFEIRKCSNCSMLFHVSVGIHILVHSRYARPLTGRCYGQCHDVDIWNHLSAMP